MASSRKRSGSSGWLFKILKMVGISSPAMLLAVLFGFLGLEPEDNPLQQSETVKRLVQKVDGYIADKIGEPATTKEVECPIHGTHAMGDDEPKRNKDRDNFRPVGNRRDRRRSDDDETQGPRAATRPERPTPKLADRPRERSFLSDLIPPTLQR